MNMVFQSKIMILKKKLIQLGVQPLKCYYCRLWKLFSGKLPNG